MAVNTWVGEGSGTDTSWAEGSNWSEGTVPDADDDVVIANVTNDPIIADGTNPTINSLLIESGGHLTAGNNNITIDGHPASGTNRSIDLSGTFVKGTSTLTFTYSAAETKYLNFRGVEVHNVVINGANTTFAIGNGALTASGYVQVTAGTLDTFSAQNNALTVTGGRIIVDGILLLNNSTVLISDTGSDLGISNSGTVTCADTNLTVNAFSCGQGAFTAPSASGSFIITGEKSGLAFDYDGNGFVHNSGTIDIRTQDTTLVDFTPNDAAHIDINNVIINHADCIATLPSAGGIGGDLTITAGKFDCAGYDLSVGSVTIASGAEFRASSGTTTITSHLSNKAISNAGTFTNNDGTVVIDITNSNKTMVDARATYHHLTINSDGSNKDVELNNLAATVEGDLTVQEGKLYTYATSGRHLTVTGHVSIEDGGEIDMNNAAGKNATFKSLEIANGGTYTATRETTTLKGEHTSGFAWSNGGTFADNDGTVAIGDGSTSIGTTHIKENRFHHLTINRDASGTSTIWRDVSGNTLTIDGNLTVTKGTFFRNTGADTFTVTGDVSVGATGILGDGGESGANNFGSLTLVSTGTYIATSGTTEITGTGTIGAGTNPYSINFSTTSTFTHNNGTILDTVSKNHHFYNGTADDLKHFTFTAGNGSDVYFAAGTATTTPMNITGDLTINSGNVRGNSSAQYITVGGNCVLAASSDASFSGLTGTHSFGSVTIGANATFSATSGTTTITNKSGDYAWNNSGTFTHNNGTVKIDTNTGNTDIHVDVKENTFYNFEMDMNGTTHEVKLQDISGNAVTIYGNLTVSRGIFQSETAGDTFTIHGNTLVEANGTFMGDANHDTNKVIHNGLVTNLGTYKINDGTTVKLNGGIRQLNTLTIA